MLGVTAEHVVSEEAREQMAEGAQRVLGADVGIAATGVAGPDEQDGPARRFEHMWSGEGTPAAIVEKRGLVQVTDTGALEALIDKLIAANPGQAEAVKAKPQAVGWFVGQVMRETQGKANPAAVNQILRAKLGG